MFFVLSKLLAFLLSPLLWIILLFLLSFFCKKKESKNKLSRIGFVLLLFFSNGFIVNEVFLAWETRPIKISELGDYEAAIVLTGVTNGNRQVQDRVHFDKGADRVLHTIQLYKLGKIKRILISGGSSNIFGNGIPEAGQLKKVFILSGIPADAILLEEKSRNTAESALYSKTKLDIIGLDNKFLLVTSAFHMRRSLGCFRKLRLNVDAYPVDFYANNRDFKISTLFIPSEYAFVNWAIFIHEIVGYLVYRFLGYS